MEDNKEGQQKKKKEKDLNHWYIIASMRSSSGLGLGETERCFLERLIRPLPEY